MSESIKMSIMKFYSNFLTDGITEGSILGPVLYSIGQMVYSEGASNQSYFIKLHVCVCILY